MKKNGFNPFLWNIAWVDHQIVIDLMSKSSLEKQDDQ